MPDDIYGDADQNWARLHSTTDATVWTDEWLRTIAEHSDIPTDWGTMVDWFANAIEVGRTAGEDALTRYEATAGTDPILLWILRRAGEDWGPMGVALVAADLVGRQHVIDRLTGPASASGPAVPDDPEALF